jgi:hypothetical protein
MHLPRNGTNAANPEFLELICIMVFHVSEYFLHFSVGLGCRLDRLAGFDSRALNLSFSALVRRRQFKTRLSRGPRARLITVAIVSSSTSASTGLGRYARCTFLHGSLAGLRRLQSGYHHDQHMGTYLCQLRLDLKAVHARHVLVEDNTVRHMIL